MNLSLSLFRIGATGLRASERKSASERVSEREGFQRFLRGFERVFRGFEVLRGFQRSSQRPSQRQISSQRLSVLLPLIMLPLELSPISLSLYLRSCVCATEGARKDPLSNGMP